MIENGEVVFFEKKENEITERIVVAEPITIGEEHYYMGVMLQRDYQSQRLYLHNVAIEKETSIEPPAHRLTTGSLDSEGRLFITTILQNAINVKQEIRRTSENNVQDSQKDARTDADIDGRVKHSLGIAAAVPVKDVYIHRRMHKIEKFCKNIQIALDKYANSVYNIARHYIL